MLSDPDFGHLHIDIIVSMKILNRNKANILLLFTRNPFAKTTTEELEYYTSDNEDLLGFVARDRIDGTFHACLLDRDSRRKYCLVEMAIDCLQEEGCGHPSSFLG